MTWVATLDELREDFALMQMAHNSLDPVDCDARIVYHSTEQEAVHVITPAPRYIAQLMAGGYTRHKRVVGADRDTGAPIFDGTNELLPAMTYEDAVEYVAWKDKPVGCNNYAILTTDDLPRVHGCIDKARKFRSAWRLEQVND
jgi:hypothetical protein